MEGADIALQNYLIDTGLLSRSQVADALRQKEQGKPFARAIIETGIISEDELRRASAQALGIPFITLVGEKIPLETLQLIPEPLSRTANIIAYRHTENGIEVALLDLADLEKVDFLRNDNRVHVRLTDRASIKHALLLYQKHLKEVFSGMLERGKDAARTLVRHALVSGAHYIHIEPGAAEATGTIVRYRIEGALHEALRLPHEAGLYIVEQLKSMARLFPVGTTVQEGSFTVDHGGHEVGVAVTAVPTIGGEKISMRLARHNEGDAGLSLDALGLHGEALELVHEALHQSAGLVVVAGEGKSTLLYTMLNYIARPSRIIASVEEHIEHRLPQVHQTATRPDLGLRLPAALRAVLRQDPDAVMVSDLMVGDAAAIACKAAERGVFILGSVPRKNAARALLALVPANSAAAPLVRLVVAQQTMRKLLPTAGTRPLLRSEGELLENKVRFGKVLAALKQEGVVHEHAAWKDILFYTAGPAEEYKGLIGIQEVLAVTPTIRQLLAAGASEEEIEKQAAEEGMLTILEDALFKSVQGLVSIEDVVRLID